MFVCVYIHLCMYIYMCVYTHICMCVYTNICVYTHMHIYTWYTHIYMRLNKYHFPVQTTQFRRAHENTTPYLTLVSITIELTR